MVLGNGYTFDRVIAILTLYIQSKFYVPSELLYHKKTMKKSSLMLFLHNTNRDEGSEERKSLKGRISKKFKNKLEIGVL